MTDELVSFRAYLDRFPLAVKGALVLRAIDGIPHQVVIHRAALSELAGAVSVPLGVEGVIQDVAPTKDLFVPFEVAVSDLVSGWYRIGCAVSIDGSPGTVQPGDPFLVPWPRTSTRRGSTDVGTATHAGHGKIRIERVACGTDVVQVFYESGDRPSIRVSASDRSLPIVEQEHDEETGRGTVSTYPLMRSESEITIDVRGAERPIHVSVA